MTAVDDDDDDEMAMLDVVLGTAELDDDEMTEPVKAADEAAGMRITTPIGGVGEFSSLPLLVFRCDGCLYDASPDEAASMVGPTTGERFELEFLTFS